jgi:hypothetical protein
VNNITIACPKCRRIGVLYATRSIAALIGSKHIAHVLHAPTDACRYTCWLTRLEFERIGIPPKKEGVIDEG